MIKKHPSEGIRLQRQRESRSKHLDQRRNPEVNLTSGDTCPQGALADCSKSVKGIEEDEKDFQQDVLGQEKSWNSGSLRKELLNSKFGWGY